MSFASNSSSGSMSKSIMSGDFLKRHSYLMHTHPFNKCDFYFFLVSFFPSVLCMCFWPGGWVNIVIKKKVVYGSNILAAKEKSENLFEMINC